MATAKKVSTKRKIVLGSISAFLLGVTILTIVRWHAWFGNKPEQGYHTPNKIDRITITPGANFTSERTISWRCGEQLQKAYIEYGIAGEDTAIIDRKWLSAEGVDITTRAGHGYFYQVKLSNLQEGKQYRYRVHTGEQHSDRYTLSMPQANQGTDFVYIGDVQDPTGEMSPELFTQLREKHLSMDFLAVAGDQVEGPSDKYWDIWYNALTPSFSSQTPIIASTGNHEYLKKGLLRELDPRWVVQYGFPQNGPTGFLGRSYYNDFPLMRFIVMDSNGISSPLDVIRHRNWLKEVLQSSGQAWQILMFHHAIHNVREGRFHPIMYYGFKDIIEDGGADLVLQGHDHAYSRITTKTDSGDSIAPLYVVSSFSPKLYRNGFNEIHDRLGSGLQLYQYIQVRPDTLRYQSFKYSGELYDDVELLQSKTKDSHIKAIDRARSIPEEFKFEDFAQSSKGRKKALQYKHDIEEYLHRKAQHKP